MSDTHTYYCAAGRSLAAIEAHNAARKAQTGAAQVITNRLGAVTHAVQGNEILGFVFAEDAEIPPSLAALKSVKLQDGRQVYTPHGRRVAGKKLAQELRDLPRSAGSRHVFRDIFESPNDARHGTGIEVVSDDGRLSIIYPGWEPLGGDFILKVPRDARGFEWIPRDAVKLKASEYWALKEAAQEAPAA